MDTSRRDRANPARESCDGGRNQSRGRRPVADLADRVVAPARDGAVAQETGVAVPGRDRARRRAARGRTAGRESENGGGGEEHATSAHRPTLQPAARAYKVRLTKRATTGTDRKSV